MATFFYNFDGTNGSAQYTGPATNGSSDQILVTVGEGAAESGYSYVIGAARSDTLSLVLPEGWYALPGNPPGPTSSAYIYDAGGNLAVTLVTTARIGAVTNICFTRGALVETPEGPRRIEDLAEGDLVLTRDHGAQPLRWIGRSTLTSEALNAMPHLRPVRIAAGALGDNAEMLVSPKHRVLLEGWRAEALFGASEILAAADSLINDATVTVARDVRDVEYFHLMFDGHELIKADGAWSESFHPAALNLGTAGRAAHDEVVAIFPELEADMDAFAGIERPTLDAGAVRVLGG